MYRFAAFVILIVFLNSCITSKNSIEYEIEDGFYKSNVFGQKEQVYIDNLDDSIFVYPLVSKQDFFQLDTVERKRVIYPQKLSQKELSNSYFTTREFDVDVITIPFKYRFPVGNQPQQLSTNLNASIYAGYRTDYYSLKYKKNKFGQQERSAKHYGLSFGGFSGFGSSPVTPWFTNDQITEEYDGLVWSNGFAVIIGIDYVNLGLSVGWDRLLDSNSTSWIYHRKPWVGLVIGININ